VHKHAEPSAHAGLIPEDGTLAQYWSSMLFWSVRISRERGVEPPSHGRLNSALTQATQLLESRGEQHAGQKREDDIHDNDAKDTLSDAGAKPRIKRTKTQSSQAGHEHTDPTPFQASSIQPTFTARLSPILNRSWRTLQHIRFLALEA